MNSPLTQRMCEPETQHNTDTRNQEKKTLLILILFILVFLLTCDARKAMAEVPGSIGTSSSLSLRLGQTLLSAGSILFMGIDLRFYRYTAFRYLVMIMALAVPWSLALAVVDVYYLLQKNKDLRNPQDHSHDFRSRLGAATSTAGVVDFIRSEKTIFAGRICNRYQFSATLAFLTRITVYDQEFWA
ncbi:PREDICTED: CASP-like protein 5C3 [Tarenaya hassleriana]|uniref:CASP-like protein 5C3 n=1 Tax=Tarenaya hassleriana TaxID=28532 RepID=UPI0008FD6DFA|nr:PREDICTED: CASP-like protein 5C3 [Tarenaya hassleriana]